MKKDSNTGVSCEICQIFKNTFFNRTPPVVSSNECIQGSLKHLRWSKLQQQLTAFSRSGLFQSSPSPKLSSPLQQHQTRDSCNRCFPAKFVKFLKNIFFIKQLEATAFGALNHNHISSHENKKAFRPFYWDIFDRT